MGGSAKDIEVLAVHDDATVACASRGLDGDAPDTPAVSPVSASRRAAERSPSPPAPPARPSLGLRGSLRALLLLLLRCGCGARAPRPRSARVLPTRGSSRASTARDASDADDAEQPLALLGERLRCSDPRTEDTLLGILEASYGTIDNFGEHLGRMLAESSEETERRLTRRPHLQGRALTDDSGGASTSGIGCSMGLRGASARASHA